MREGDDVWLVGQDERSGELRIVRARVYRVFPAEVLVNLRPGCRNPHVETVPREKVYATRELAEARVAELER